MRKIQSVLPDDLAFRPAVQDLEMVDCDTVFCTSDIVDAAYREMADDVERETLALAWSEGTIIG